MSEDHAEAFRRPTGDERIDIEEIIWFQGQIEHFSMLARYGDACARSVIESAESRMADLRARLSEGI